MPPATSYVTDFENNRVQKFTSSGLFITKWGSAGVGDGQFYFTTGIAVDSRGIVYVADENNCRVQVFTNSGGYLGQWGSYGSGNGQFYSPMGVALDGGGNIYVADTNNYRIQKFGPLPTPTRATTWGRLKRMYR
jgi:DNA-binding beta-propeller fold protein YncE